MSFSATRLTCFALLAAMEHDMRDAAETYIGQRDVETALPSERAERAQLRRAKDKLAPTTSLPALLPYLDFADSYELLQSNSSDLPSDLGKCLGMIASSVSRIVAIRNRVAHTRPMEIDDSAFLLDRVRDLVWAAPSAWPVITETIQRLESDPSYVLGLTISLPSDPERGPQHNLPVPDFDETGFFGRRDELRRIKKAIKGPYPVVSILGDGGIGKTSIALKAAYDLLEEPSSQFDAIVWVTAKATMLTPHEIQQINGAIKTSLGLFARAADELGGANSADPVKDVLEYLENFRILLVLDNLETVLDSRLRDFLLELPHGSKVLITSRISLGIENPVHLGPISEEDATRLLRALARIRNVVSLERLPQESIERIASQMDGHPAYIRWFVAGIQSGKRPEDLIGNNELLLDFCMSNVYEYLKEDARAAVRSMQVLTGGRNQAEIAYLNDFSAVQTQAALLELITTNFVQMATKMTGSSMDTTYELSDFARQYLDKHHPVLHSEREWLLGRYQELSDLGFAYSVETDASPYAPETVSTRGLGDVHAARILREALRVADEDPNKARVLCKEAQLLAPTYFEAWRVEGHLSSMVGDYGSARAAFERAQELAPESPVVGYHRGAFLLTLAGDPRGGLVALQAAARQDTEGPEIVAQISWAHYCLGDMANSVASALHVAAMRQTSSTMRSAAMSVAVRAATAALYDNQSDEEAATALELTESVLDALGDGKSISLAGELADRMLLLLERLDLISRQSDGYSAKVSLGFVGQIQDIMAAVDSMSSTRTVGSVTNVIIEKRYGFIREGKRDHFFHYRDLIDKRDWEVIGPEVRCAFNSVSNHPKGWRAELVRVLQ